MPASLFVICQGSQPITDETASTSVTAFTWTERLTALGGQQANRITYGNGVFVCGVLAQASEAIQTSPNGITWTKRHSPADAGDNEGAVRSIVWAEELGLFVAIYQTDHVGVMTSPDGATWTDHTIPSPGIVWYALAWSPELGLLVAVNFDGNAVVMTSSDGATWTESAIPDGSDWRCVVWGAGLFVAFAGGFLAPGNPILMTSPDGFTWTTQPDPGNQSIEAVIFANEQFVACGLGELTEDLLRVLTSPDGLTWTPQTTTARTWWALTYGLGLYVMVANDDPGDGSKAVATSPDAITWTERGSDVYPVTCRGIAWAPISTSGNYLDGPGQGGNQAW